METYSCCRIVFRPKNCEQERNLAGIIQQFKSDLDANSYYTYTANKLSLGGWGADHRCQLCKSIRQRAKEDGIVFRVRCPYEQDDTFSWRIKVGKSYFDISLLEREQQYRVRKETEPNNLLVRTHLAVIHEYFGRYAAALKEYLYILKQNPADGFARRRFKVVSRLLLKQKEAQTSSREIIDSSK